MTTRTLYADPTQALTSAVHRFDRRKKTQQTLLWLPRGLTIALLIGVMMAVAARLRPLLTNSQIALFAAGVVVAAVVICMAVVWGRRKSAIALAQRFDIDFDLHERVSTALELNSGRIEAPDWLAADQIADAEATTAAALTNLNSRLPLKFVRRDWVMVILLGIAIALLLALPNPQADALSRNAAVDAAIAEAAETLEEVAEDVAADPSLDATERQSLLEDLRQRIEGLQNQEVTPEEAFASLSEASAELQEQSDQLGSRSGASQAALERTAENLRDAGFGGEEAASGEPLEQVTEGLEQISEQASQMSESERQQAADALQNAAESMQNSQMSQSQQQASESLESAAESLEQGDTQTAQEQLQQAQQQMEQSASEAQQQQQSQQNLSEAAQEARESASQVSEAQQQQQQQQGAQSQQSQQSDQGQEGERGSPQQGDQQSAQQENGQQTTGEGSQQSPESQLSQMGAPGDTQSQSNQGAPSDTNTNQATAGDAQGSDGSDQQLQAAGEQQQVSQDNNADGQGEREFEAVNVPRQVGGEFSDDAIILEADPSDSPVQEGNFSQNPEGQVSVPYNEVFGNYRNIANRALDSGYVPLALRDVVRDYFTSLEPQSGR
jgi:hypothetical protein